MDAVTDIPGVLPLWRSVSGGDPEIRIAIIDGPVDVGHPSLQTARVAFDQQPGVRTAPIVWSEHGTHVSSVIVGQPGSPGVGIAPNCTIGWTTHGRPGADARDRSRYILAVNR